MIQIRPGEFVMGLPDANNDGHVPKESPAHRVIVSRAFWIGSTEVTQQQYAEVTGANPSWHVTAARVDNPQLIAGPRHDEDFDDFPVESVSWFDAVAFCEKLTSIERASGHRRTYRLPTEAEWEYVCRGGRKGPYAFTRHVASGDHSGDNARKSPTSYLVTDVGSFAPNAFGVFDMRGNVFEWCQDWFSKDYYDTSPVYDPAGPPRGFLKVVRGGDWRFVGESCKLGVDPTAPWHSSRYIGFRVVCFQE